MRFVLVGLLFAMIFFAAAGGHVFLLPLFLLLPLGGLFARRATHGRRS